MPTYQYACTNPDGRHEFELVQSFTDDPVSECPECGSGVRKVYGSVGVVFKGSGFYRTDSRNGSSEKKKAGESSEKKSSDKASSGGSSSATETPSSSATPAASGSKAAAG